MDRRLAAVAVSRLRLGGGGTPHHTPAAFRSAARREQTFKVAPSIIVDFAEGKFASENADAGRERRKVQGTTIAVRRGCSRQVHLTPHGSLSYPSPMPFRLSGNPIPSSGVSKIINVAVLAVRSCPKSLSSITTSATQPLGRQRTKPARPTSTLSSFRPSPDGSSTPSGATTRISLLFWSAVFSTMTVRPALERSSATTLWIRAHCSPCAPGGVSQRICQSPWTERTAPCAPAEAVRPNRNATARMPPAKLTANGLPRLAALLALCFEGPIGVDPLKFPWKCRSEPRTDTAITAP